MAGDAAGKGVVHTNSGVVLSISESLPVSGFVDERGLGALRSPTVAVVGLGYVGLPTALALQKAGVSVIGIDISPARVEQILAGSPDLLKADLRQLAIARGELALFRVGSDLSVMTEADCVLICVPTPIDDRQTPNLAPLQSACAAVVANARAGQTFVLTSTTYVGCTRDYWSSRSQHVASPQAATSTCVLRQSELILPTRHSSSQRSQRLSVGSRPSASKPPFRRSAASLPGSTSCLHQKPPR